MTSSWYIVSLMNQSTCRLIKYENAVFSKQALQRNPLTPSTYGHYTIIIVSKFTRSHRMKDFRQINQLATSPCMENGFDCRYASIHYVISIITHR